MKQIIESDSPNRISVREVGMRDGLQSIATLMPSEEKIRWCEYEFSAGVDEIEVGSFVPPRLLPQMADTADIVAKARTLAGLTVSVLVPNLKGAERAVAAGAMKLNYAMSVSESHNWSNVRRQSGESLADFGRIVEFCRNVDPTIRPIVSGGLATSFGCTIEGEVLEKRVLEFAVRMAELGAEEIVLADTVGYGNPSAVRRLFGAVRKEIGDLPLAAHFHDTRGLGLANVVAALDAGITRFDASLGGLGGCPYAPGATGNIVMEDLVFLLESMGYETMVNLPALLKVRNFLQECLPGESFYGGLAKCGLPKGFSAVRRSLATAVPSE